MTAPRFDTATEKFSQSSNLVDVANAYTVSFWAYMSAALATDAFATLWITGNNEIFGSGTAQIEGFDFTELSGNVRLESYTTTSGTYLGNGRGTTNLSASTWYYCALRRNSSTSLTMHLATQAGVLTQESSVTDAVGTRSSTRTDMASAWSINSDPFNGRLAAFKAWNVALSNDELLNESRRYRPYRLENLFQFVPVIGAATDATSYDPTGRNFTVGGTPTLEKGPPIPW